MAQREVAKREEAQREEAQREVAKREEAQREEPQREEPQREVAEGEEAEGEEAKGEDEKARTIGRYFDETRQKLVPILSMTRKPRSENQDLYKNKFTLLFLFTQATGQRDIMHTSESTPRPRLRTPGTLVQDEHS